MSANFQDAIDPSKIPWRPPWRALSADEARKMEEELSREINNGHLLSAVRRRQSAAAKTTTTFCFISATRRRASPSSISRTERRRTRSGRIRFCMIRSTPGSISVCRGTRKNRLYYFQLLPPLVNVKKTYQTRSRSGRGAVW